MKFIFGIHGLLFFCDQLHNIAIFLVLSLEIVEIIIHYIGHLLFIVVIICTPIFIYFSFFNYFIVLLDLVFFLIRIKKVLS